MPKQIGIGLRKCKNLLRYATFDSFAKTFVIHNSLYKLWSLDEAVLRPPLPAVPGDNFPLFSPLVPPLRSRRIDTVSCETRQTFRVSEPWLIPRICVAARA